MNPIALVAIGNPQRELLDSVRPALAREFRTECHHQALRIDPRPAYHSERNQYHSTEILQTLHAAKEALQKSLPCHSEPRSQRGIPGEYEGDPSRSAAFGMTGGVAPPLPNGSGSIFLGITDVDLFIPILTFVFGEAQLGGSVAIISHHRLQQEFYGLPPDDRLLQERTIKEAIHEVGHVVGLTHCHDYDCVMASSHAVEWLDLKGMTFCDHCRSLLT